MSGSGRADGEDVAVGVGVVVQHGKDGRLAGADPEGVGFGDRRAVGFGAVRQDGLLDLVGGVLVRVVRGLLRRDDVVPVVHQLHVLVHQPHIARIHIVEHHHVPVHPEHIARRRGRLRHIHGPVIGITAAVPHILIRPGPRRMHTTTQLHRRRRHPLPAERHRLRRRTIQRHLKKRLRRRDRHRTRPRTGLLQLRILRIRQRQLTPARQQQLPGRPRPAPPADPPPRSTGCCPHPSNPPTCSPANPSPCHRHPRPSPSPDPISDPHCKSGHRSPPPTPSPAPPTAPAPNSPHQNHSPSTATTPTPGPAPHPSPQSPATRNSPPPTPGNFLSPPKRICAADTWFNVEPDASSTNTVPASCNTSNVVDAGVTAPSNTRDG